MATESEEPYCVVLGLETQIGLNVVRELGRAGVRVIGVAQSPHAIGLRSRYLWKGLIETRTRSAELLRLLSTLGEQHGACPLLAISEANLLWLQQHQDEIRPLRAVLPPPEALRTVLDKTATLEAAHAVGIAVPRSWQPVTHAEVLAQAADFPMPAVLKWSDPNGVTKRLEAAALPLLKAEYVGSAAELTKALSRYSALEIWPLVQQYCPGYGLGQFFFMHQGQAVRSFQHRRVCEWPPEGGVSSVADAIPLSAHRALQAQSVALLQHIGWQGVAMVEYRHDPSTGSSWLMEVNGRFWGSFPLSVHCGAGFARLSHAAGAGAPLPHLPPVRDGLRCRMVATELKRLKRILWEPAAIADKQFQREPVREVWRFLKDFFNPASRYYVAAADDPRPLVADLVNVIRRR